MWCHRRSSEKEDLLGLIIMCGPAASSCSTRCPRRRPQGRPKKQVRGGAQQWRGKKPAGARSAERWFAFLLFHRGLKLFGPQRVDPSCRARRRSSLRGLSYKCGRRYTQSRLGEGMRAPQTGKEDLVTFGFHSSVFQRLQSVLSSRGAVCICRCEWPMRPSLFVLFSAFPKSRADVTSNAAMDSDPRTDSGPGVPTLPHVATQNNTNVAQHTPPRSQYFANNILCPPVRIDGPARWCCRRSRRRRRSSGFFSIPSRRGGSVIAAFV